MVVIKYLQFGAAQAPRVATFELSHPAFLVIYPSISVSRR